MVKKMTLALGILVTVTLAIFIAYRYMSSTVYAPALKGTMPAMLSCMADNHCPVGLTCANGACVEAFTVNVGPVKDMASCGANDCNHVSNSNCSRRETPCPEGTFCQNDACINIEAPDHGEAYNQIGMLSLND